MIGEDGSHLYPWLELTHLGEAICLNEYAANIARHNNTHLLQVDDYQQSMNQHLTTDNILLNNKSLEFILTTRKGRKSHIFIPECGLSQIMPLLLDRKENISQVFCFPYHLQECGAEIHVWEDNEKFD